MNNLKQLDQARADFKQWLEFNGAEDVRVLDDSDELNFHFHIVTGFFINKPFVACFGMSSEDHIWVTFSGNGVRLKGLSVEQFNQYLSTLEKPVEHTLERWELGADEKVEITNDNGITIYELKQKN